MNKVLLDTNIILDFALDRVPFAEEAEQILNMAFDRKLLASISASSVTDIYYIMRKAKGRNFALDFLKNLLDFIDIANVDKQIIKEALESSLYDFEDAVQDHSAKRNDMDMIISRNEKDFINANTKVLTPTMFLNTLKP